MLHVILLLLSINLNILKYSNEQFVSRILYTASSRSGYRLQRKDVEKVTKIIQKESNFKVNAYNRKSRAYGLYQFLPKTYTYVNQKKSSCPIQQTQAFLAYIRKRYGTIHKAYVFRNRNGWY